MITDVCHERLTRQNAKLWIYAWVYDLTLAHFITWKACLYKEIPSLGYFFRTHFYKKLY